MKGGGVSRRDQMDMLEEIDRFQLEREKREEQERIWRLDEKFSRMEKERFRRKEYPAGSVIIVGQKLFRNGRYTMHFYRTVLNYYSSCTDPKHEVLVEATNEEFPERPPWADTVGHEGEPKDIHMEPEHTHWVTGEVVEPIVTWWMRRWFGEGEQG